MSVAVPYIGSKISLISKSEIRYEGILYTIDTKESTVALQNVRSFGTEGRKKEGDQIPPSNEVYDYIIFRGADIKDLHVVETPPQATMPPARPHDPAIISMQNPATLPHSTPNQGYPYPNYQYGPMSNPQFQMGPWGYGMPPNQYYPSFAPQTSLGGNQQNPQATAQNQNRPQQQTQPSTQEKKPTQSSQTTQEQKPPQQQPPQQQSIQEPPKSEKSLEPVQTQSTPVDTQQTVQPSQQSAPQPVQNGENSTAQQQQPQQQRHSYRGRGGNQRNNQGRYNQGGYNQGGYNQGDNRGGRGGGQRRPNSGNRNPAPNGSKTLDEFDLEASNARFEKEKILSEVAAQQATETNADKAYDKTSSFFDNISCEATDRMKEKATNEKRKNDSDMRKLDAETFGIEKLNMRGGGRGGYRGGRGGGQRRYGYNNSNNNQNQRDNKQNNQSNSNSLHQKQVFRPVSGSPGRDNRNRSENKPQ